MSPTDKANVHPLGLVMTITPNPAALPAGFGPGTYRLKSEAAAALAGDPTAIRTISMSWSRPGPLDHLEPYTWTAEIMGSSLALQAQLTYDAEVVVTAAPDGAAPTTIARGWVRDIVRTRYGDPDKDLWICRLTLDGPTARADATRIGDKPWNESNSTTRMRWIGGLSLPMLTPPYAGGSSSVTSVTVAARDVDSASALDVYRRTAAAQGAFCTEGIRPKDGALVVTHTVLSGTSLTRENNLIVMIGVNGTPDVPASAIAEAPRVMNRAGLFTHADLITRDAEGNDQIERLTATTATDLPASVWRWETDAATGKNPGLTTWVQGILDSTCTPSWEYAGPQRIVLSQITAATVWTFLDPDSRYNLVIRVNNGPRDMPRLMAVTDVALTLGDDKLLDLTVSMVSAARTGTGPAQFNDFTENQAWMTQKTPAARWSEFPSYRHFDQITQLNI